MKNDTTLLFRGSIKIPKDPNSPVTFRLLDKEVCVEAPHLLIEKIISFCDGRNWLKSILDELSSDWDLESVSGLIDELFRNGVLIDSKHIANSIFSFTKSPLRFPIEITEAEVSKLTLNANGKVGDAQTELRPTGNNLSEIISKRVSGRFFSETKPTTQSVVDLLWSAYGITATNGSINHRTVPSAGALYPLTIHIGLLKKSDDFETGVYEVIYHKDSSVELNLVSYDTLKLIRAFSNPIEIQNGAHGVIVISGSFNAVSEKYGGRSAIFVPLEAGHSAQNILLESTRQGLASYEVGGFADDLVARAIGLEENSHPLTTIVFGGIGEETKPSQENNLNITIQWATPTHEKYKPGFAIASTQLSPKCPWSHGRDPSPRLALTKAISEAKEWSSCGCIPDLTVGKISDFREIIDPRDVIRFHPTQYQAKDFPFSQFDENVEYAWAEGANLVGKKYKVLADHVYFPFYPKTPEYCYSNSSGCAAHPDKDKAIETGTLELVERDSFMNAYLCRLKLPKIDFGSLPEAIQSRIQDLQQCGFDVQIIDHSLDLAPVIFVFAQNNELNYTTCASCSSFDVEYATGHALMEVEASILHRLQSGQPKSIDPSEVYWPNDHGVLYGNKKWYRKADFLASSTEIIDLKSAGAHCSKDWMSLLKIFEKKNWKHLIVPLNLSEPYGRNGDLTIIRAIIPGTVQMTFGSFQEPRGMERIYDISEKFGIGRLKHNKLTTFPHPFE